MNNTNQNNSHTVRIIGILFVTAMLLTCGCGGFFDKKTIETRTMKMLNEIKEIHENTDTKNPLPEMYRGPAKKIKVKDGVKLFYFTKHHTVDKLAKLLREQFATMSTNKEGKTIYAPKYAIGESTATNQLVIDCPNDLEVDKVLEFLEMVDVMPIQVNIDCLILEHFADVSMDWETTLLIENLFGERLTIGESKYPGPIFPGASIRESTRSTFGLDIGFWRNQGITGHQLRVIIDMLISRGYLKIIMNPTLETVNGQKAKISSRDFVPIEKIVTQRDVLPYSITEYQWVEDALEVTPHVFADGSIGLETTIKLGSRSKPEGAVQVSIITERSIDVAENRIKPGNSLIIGGLKKTVERAVIRGTPLLKDIPIIGSLFSSKDFEESATELIFILTPSISSGGVKYADMIEDVRKKQFGPKYKPGLHKTPTNPLGAAAHTKNVKQTKITGFDQLQSEIEKAETLKEVNRMKKELLETTKAEKAKVDAQKTTIKKELKRVLESLSQE